MRVTFREQSKIPPLLDILVEGEVYRTVIAQGFGKECKGEKEFSSYQQIDAWFFALEYRYAKNYVCKLLAKRHYPTHILQRKLQERRISQTSIAKTLSFFEKRKYINNEEWIQSFVQAQLQRGWGPKAIFAKLLEKGFTREEFSSLAQAYLTPSRQKQKIKELLKRTTKQKQMQQIVYLQRRGFCFALIEEVLQEIN